MPWTEVGPASCRRENLTIEFSAIAGVRICLMHGTVSPQITVCPSKESHQWLFEVARPGPVDYPHRARLYLLSFIVQNYWSRWSHHRRCFADLRWNGKVYCKPDETWDTVMAKGLGDAVSRNIDKEAEIFGREYLDNDSVMVDLPPVPSDWSCVCRYVFVAQGARPLPDGEFVRTLAWLSLIC
jgi:hypothetical protein